MNSMKLLHKYQLNIMGKNVGDVTIKEEWNGLIELDGGINKGKIIVRLKDQTNGAKWARERDAFNDQELDIIYADERFGLPKTQINFVAETKQDA